MVYPLRLAMHAALKKSSFLTLGNMILAAPFPITEGKIALI